MIVKSKAALKCLACDTPLSRNRGIEGLCPGCLIELALDDTALEAELLVETGEAPTLQFTPDHTFSEGEIQGERYRIRSLLGRGGMGEVWRAYDLKLRLDVALKALRSELIQDQHALETLRQEVRTAREVISPNVCRVFDLEEFDGQELISMEYVDGTTLQEILKQRGPLDLNEAREIASQLLAGLEAIHEAGLVHRDIKPENVMLTRTGRVVVMDFGIAKGLGEGKSGMIAGTPAYMSPEQARGGELDARSDLFAAGVVLAEMLEPGGVGTLEARQRVWEGLRQERPRVSDIPWSKVITQAVAPEREDRCESASALARALEEVTLRAAGDETARPYPGLSAFQQEDAEFFYGREFEVEALWKKLRRPHLLAVIGPSGAGKSSFLQAGLLPTLTDGWRALITTPGNRPFANLARALAEQLPEDRSTVDALLRIDEPETAIDLISQWREGGKHGLIILDQFEELFTQNPEPVQQDFAEFLGRLPLEADVHVLLSMRDDFLMHCHRFEALKPVFSELSPLDPPLGASLRRALVEPALKCGYRFEDEGIVEEMLSEVEGQRGALPMLAFAAAQLWERKNHESGLLTCKAYEQIGGVSGALAQHAEAMLDYIGESNTPIVRELLRNLVTAQGTRASRDREELLSVFPETEGEPFHEPSQVGITQAPPPKRPAAKHVLDSLIDARLLTSYEIPAHEEGEPHHRIEIVHESLLARWPRLVRWQMQDAEGAQLRDELRHQARIWDEKRRPGDLLWTGTAFREYELWRERYPGGLTTVEEEYARAMVARAERRQRHRRIAVAVSFIVLLAVLGIIGGFWRRSVSESRRAEAANLYSIAQLKLEDHPTAAIAYATAGLELADMPDLRLLALTALWRGPTEFRIPTGGFYSVEFSPDARWLVPDGDGGTIWPADGGEPTALENSDVCLEIQISPQGDLLAHLMDRERRELGLWSFPKGRFLRSISLSLGGGMAETFQFSPDGKRLIIASQTPMEGYSLLEVRSWAVEGGEPDLIDSFEVPFGSIGTFPQMDPSGTRYAWAEDSRVVVASLEGTTLHRATAREVDHGRPVVGQLFDQQGRFLMTADKTGVGKIWSLEHDPPIVIRTIQGEGGLFTAWPNPSGSMIVHSEGLLWDLTGPPDAEPLRLRRAAGAIKAEARELGFGLAFHPESTWVATGRLFSTSLWPLGRPYPRVFRGHASHLSFTPDGRWLIAASDEDGSVRGWPLDPGAGKRTQLLDLAEEVYASPTDLEVAPDGEYAVVGRNNGLVKVLPLDGGSPVELTGFTDGISTVAVGPDAGLVAAGAGNYKKEEAIVRLWNLETGESRILDVSEMGQIGALEFTLEGDLWVDIGSTYRLLDLTQPEPRPVNEVDLSGADRSSFAVQDVSAGGDLILFIRFAPEHRGVWIHDLKDDASRELISHGSSMVAAVFAVTGNAIITADTFGVIRVGPVDGSEPHLLLGHEGQVTALAVSPDGRWIASAGQDETIRLWPMPDLSQPPLHTWPHEELLAKLRTLTNLQAVRNSESTTGWKLEIGPFPGWEEVPTW